MGLMKGMNKKIKKLDWVDVGLIKGAVFFLTLFLITVWSSFRVFIMNYQWYWYLIIGIILAIIPVKNFFE